MHRSPYSRLNKHEHLALQVAHFGIIVILILLLAINLTACDSSTGNSGDTSASPPSNTTSSSSQSGKASSQQPGQGNNAQSGSNTQGQNGGNTQGQNGETNQGQNGGNTQGQNEGNTQGQNGETNQGQNGGNTQGQNGSNTQGQSGGNTGNTQGQNGGSNQGQNGNNSTDNYDPSSFTATTANGIEVWGYANNSDPDYTHAIDLYNSGTSPIPWSATVEPAASWIKVDPTSGTLQGNQHQWVNVHFLSVEQNLAVADYTCTIVFTPKNPATDNDKPVTLHVVAQPTITAVSSNSGPDNGGQTITISGQNLSNVKSVYFDTQDATISTQNDNQIVLVTPPGKGTVNILAYGPSGLQPVTVGQFTYVSGTSSNVTVSGISPSSQKPYYSITITGSGFTDNANNVTVFFGTTPVNGTGILSASDTTLTVTVPEGASGTTVDITVSTPNGTSPVTPNDKFTYQ